MIVLAQKDGKQNYPSQAKTKMEALNEQGIFGKVSSTETEADEGFRIVAVRKVYVMLNSPYDDEPSNQTRKDYIEIELFAKILPAATNMPDIVQIGDRIFSPEELPCRNNKNCIKVVMTPKDFDNLKDNSLVTLYKGMPVAPDVLKELYKNGEPKQVVGAKFGRLSKKSIEAFPPVERKSVQ